MLFKVFNRIKVPSMTHITVNVSTRKCNTLSIIGDSFDCFNHDLLIKTLNDNWN